MFSSCAASAEMCCPIRWGCFERFPKIMRKRKQGRGLQDKAEDAGRLTPAKDGNEVIQFPDR